MKKSRVSIIVITFVLIAFAFMAAGCTQLKASMEFAAEAWRNEPAKRLDMVSDLLDTHELVGLTKDEIIDLLGEPTDIDSGYRCRGVENSSETIDPKYIPQREINLAEENFLFYPMSNLPIPDYATSLYFELDEDDTVVNVYMVSLET